jgi:DNA-binding CsgD family transcriptional regulator
MDLIKKDPKRAAILEYLTQHPTASLSELGNFLGISRQRAHVLLREMNLQTNWRDREPTFTHRQLEILRLVGRGYTDKQIAAVLACSPQTIGNHLQVIYRKLNVHKRKHAVQLVIEQGLIVPTSGNLPSYISV